MIIKSVVTDYQIIVTAILVLAAWRWGDWRNWKLYYPTMLFFAVGDFSAHLLLYNYPLWSFESSILRKTFSDFLITLVFFPATLLLYLPHFPKKPLFKILYVSAWAVTYTIVEAISGALGFFSHYHGWTIWWSLAFNLLMFPIFRIHFKRPLAAIAISFVCAVSLIVYFRIPLDTVV